MSIRKQTPVISKRKELFCDLCDLPDKNPAEAVCLTCNIFVCLKCTIGHIQQNSSHLVKEINKTACNLISTKARKLYDNLGKHLQGIKKSRNQKNPQTLNVSPQIFQKYLNEIEFIKKEVLQTVDRFFQELSLEFVTMWENYLLKFSSGAAAIQKMNQYLNRLKPFTTQQGIIKAPQLIKTYLAENFQEKIQEILSKDPINDVKLQQALSLALLSSTFSQLQQVLCTGISTINYRFLKDKGIKIDTECTLDKIQKVPVMPLKANFFFQYSLRDNSLEVLQIQSKANMSPFPKCILLKNGLLHIMGGSLQNGQPSSQHFSFNVLGQLLIKKNLPKPRNPVNSLIEHSGRIYLIGGQRNKGQWSSQCWYYTIGKDEWTTIQSMARQKPQQSSFLWKQQIYIFGISLTQGFVNIQALSLSSLKWRPVSLKNYLSNPFNFAASFVCIPINNQEVLFFGGKKYQQSFRDPNKRLTDQNVSKNVYTFCPESLSFARQQCELPTTGVTYSQLNPIVFENRVFSFEFVVAKVGPITRWFQTMQVLSIKNESQIECLLVMQQ